MELLTHMQTTVFNHVDQFIKEQYGFNTT